MYTHIQHITWLLRKIDSLFTQKKEVDILSSKNNSRHDYTTTINAYGNDLWNGHTNVKNKLLNMMNSKGIIIILQQNSDTQNLRNTKARNQQIAPYFFKEALVWRIIFPKNNIMVNSSKFQLSKKNSKFWHKVTLIFCSNYRGIFTRRIIAVEYLS